MISIIETGALLNPDMTPMNAASATLVGLSTDTPKPTNAGNGWIFSEIDTGKIYIYDAENSTWREWSNGGSGGGGGSGGTFIANMDATTGTLDKTFKEIYDAIAAGKIGYVRLYIAEDDLYFIYYIQEVYNGQFVVVGGNIGDTGQVASLVFSAANENEYPVVVTD